MAEDNLVNQKMAFKMLTKAGYHVDIVDNGRLAVKAAATKKYDLILMDVQMPEMDGFEATKIIRSREAECERKNVIIAMTAHAMKGDKERCLEQGMNDYISKPFEPKILLGIIENWTKGKERSNPARLKQVCSAEEATTAKEQRVVDLESAMERFSDDREFYSELLHDFLAQAPVTLQQISDAIQTGQSEELSKVAHSFKSAAGTLSATEIYILAQKLERIGREDSIDEALPLFEKLEGEIRHLGQFAQSF